MRGWTVRGLDPGTGRVVVNRRAGDEVETRSVSLDEYQSASSNPSPRRRRGDRRPAPPPTAFRLQDVVADEDMNVRVREYDAASNAVLVDGFVGDEPVRKWVSREKLEAAARETTPEASKAFRAAVIEEPPAPSAVPAETDEEESAPRDAAQRAVSAPQQAEEAAEEEADEDVDEDEIEEPEPEARENRPEEGIAETREALREARLRTATRAALQEDVRTGAISKEVLDQAGAEIDQRIEALQARPEAEKTPDENVEIEKLQAARADLATVARFAERNAELKTMEGALTQARASGDTRQVMSLTRQIRTARREVAGLQTEALNASGKIEVAIPNFASRAEIRATVPGASSARIEVSGRAPAVPSGVQLSVAGGAGAAPAAIAAAVATATPAQLVATANDAIANLNAVVNRRQQNLKNIRAEIRGIGDQYSRVASERDRAAQAGNQPLVIELNDSLAGIDERRRDLQNRQLTATVDVAQARKVRDRLQTLAGNVSASGENPPPELVDELRSAIPEGFQLNIESGVEPAAAPESKRSYAAATPRRSQNQTASFRDRLKSRLGLPLQTASAAAIAGEAPAASGYREGVGPDAYQQALSYEGGAGELSLPSYTTDVLPQDEAEEQDVYGGGLAAQKKQRSIEKQQRDARELLLPGTGPVPIGAASEPEAFGQARELFPEPGEAPSPFTREPGDAARFVGGRARDIAREARARGAEQAYAKVASQAAFGGQLGGDSSNVEGARRLKRMWDLAKAGESLTFVGIILAIATMNVQMINKYTFKSEMIPTQSLIEDFLTLLVDFNLIIICALPFVIPAAILGIIGAAVAVPLGFVLGGS